MNSSMGLDQTGHFFVCLLHACDGHWSFYVCIFRQIIAIYELLMDILCVVSASESRSIGIILPYYELVNDLILYRITRTNGQYERERTQPTAERKKTCPARVIDIWDSDSTRGLFPDTDFPIKPFFEYTQITITQASNLFQLKWNFKIKHHFAQFFVLLPLLCCAVIIWNVSIGHDKRTNFHCSRNGFFLLVITCIYTNLCVCIGLNWGLLLIKLEQSRFFSRCLSFSIRSNFPIDLWPLFCCFTRTPSFTGISFAGEMNLRPKCIRMV